MEEKRRHFGLFTEKQLPQKGSYFKYLRIFSDLSGYYNIESEVVISPVDTITKEKSYSIMTVTVEKFLFGDMLNPSYILFLPKIDTRFKYGIVRSIPKIEQDNEVYFWEEGLELRKESVAILKITKVIENVYECLTSKSTNVLVFLLV